MKRKGMYFPGLGTWPAKDLKIWREEWQRATLDGGDEHDPMKRADEVAHRVLMRMSGVSWAAKTKVPRARLLTMDEVKREAEKNVAACLRRRYGC